MRLNDLTKYMLIFILALCGCSQTFLLLSPDDLYVLGNQYMEDGNFRDASEKFEQIRNDYPTSKFATMSQFKLAVAEYERGNYAEAAVEFELFIEFHPGHKMAPQAQYYVALSKFNSFPSPERDITMALEARKELTEFLRLYPGHPDSQKVQNYLNNVNDHLQTHEIEVAKVYYRRGSYEAAINRLVPVDSSAASDEVKQKASMLLARSYEQNENKEEAVNTYRKVIELGFDQEMNDEALKKINLLSN